MNPKNKMSKKKKIIIALLIIFSPLIAILGLLAYNFITDPIYNYFDQQKFTKLDQDSQKIFQELTTQATSDEKWEYNKGCAADHGLGGPFPTGLYNCLTSAYLKKVIISAEEVKSTSDKFISVLDKSKYLSIYSQLDTAGSFGQGLYNSSATKEYTETNTKTNCEYHASLEPTGATGLLDLGSDITTEATLELVFECRDKGYESWYPVIANTDTTPADFTLD